MIFRSRSKSSRRRPSTSATGFSYRPLLHVLAPGQTANDFQDPIEHNFRAGDVVISRAELDLRRSVQNLMIHTGLAVNSLEVLTALQLPGSTAALFWAIVLLLGDDLPAEMSETHLIRKRDHDSRLLYQALARIDLDDWYHTLVDKALVTALPTGLQFPPGHPVSQRYYRQHSLPAKPQVYLPVANYFSALFNERKQELLRLLVNLGATRVEIQPLGTATAPEVLVYPGRPWSPNLNLNLSDYAWLPYEEFWQTLMSQRVAGHVTTARLTLTVDINGMLNTQLDALKNLATQLDSVASLDQSALDQQYLQPHQVTVTFA